MMTADEDAGWRAAVDEATTLPIGSNVVVPARIVLAIEQEYRSALALSSDTIPAALFGFVWGGFVVGVAIVCYLKLTVLH